MKQRLLAVRLAVLKDVQFGRHVGHEKWITREERKTKARRQQRWMAQAVGWLRQAAAVAAASNAHVAAATATAARTSADVESSIGTDAREEGMSQRRLPATATAAAAAAACRPSAAHSRLSPLVFCCSEHYGDSVAATIAAAAATPS